MNPIPFFDYQRQLIVASLDDFTPNSVFPTFQGGQYGGNAKNWQKAVIDFLCLNLKCGLIEVTHRPEISVTRDEHALRKLLIDGDEKNCICTDILWDILYFNGTDFLAKFVDYFGLKKWDAINYGECNDFIAVLKKIYGCN